MKIKYIILLICGLIGSIAKSQGKVTIVESPGVKSMFESFVTKNRAETTIKGWRIQIVSTDDRREMESTRSKFASLYPGIPSAWKHVSPYYHIRVGAYKSKTELMRFLTEIKKDFPAAIAIMDDIQKYDLVNF